MFVRVLLKMINELKNDSVCLRIFRTSAKGGGDWGNVGGRKTQFRSSPDLTRSGVLPPHVEKRLETTGKEKKHLLLPPT